MTPSQRATDPRVPQEWQQISAMIEQPKILLARWASLEGRTDLIPDTDVQDVPPTDVGKVETRRQWVYHHTVD